MLHQYGGGYHADAAGNGCDGPRHSFGLVKENIPHHFAVLPVGTDIHHHGTGLHMGSGDQSRTAGGSDENIGLPGDGSQIRRPGMGHGDGGVPLQQQHGRRLSDDTAAAHYAGPFPCQRNLIVLQKPQAGLSGTGSKATLFPCRRSAFR